MRVSARIAGILKGESRLPLYYFGLAPLSLLYGTVMRARAGLYRLGILRSSALPCKVISVGNLTAGGTGKTPMVVYLTRLLKSKGLKAAVLTRGYGGSLEGRVETVSDGDVVLLEPSQAGDEAVMLAMDLTGVPVIMGSDRYQAGRLAVERFKSDVVIIDDGYQHMALKRDLDILLMDAGHPFGNGFVLPMGYLREPKGAVRRADVVVLTRSGIGLGPPGEARSDGRPEVSKIAPALPVIRAAYMARRAYGLWDGVEAGLEGLSGRQALAVSGVAGPASFALILKKLNVKIAGTAEYPDHYVYAQEDIARIEARAEASGAEFAITTEKDAVKLSRLKPGRLKFLALGVEVGIIDGAEALETLIDEKIMVG